MECIIAAEYLSVWRYVSTGEIVVLLYVLLLLLPGLFIEIFRYVDIYAIFRA